MGTGSLTYVYNTNGKIIFIMYRQFDGYPEDHGLDIAEFLLSQRDSEMRKLADDLFSHFQETQGNYIKEVPLDDPYFWCHDYQYHIYSDKVKIVGMEKDCEFNWKTDEFKTFCKGMEEEDAAAAAEEETANVAAFVINC